MIDNASTSMVKAGDQGLQITFPDVDVHGPRKLTYYMLSSAEIDRLQSASSAESQAANFFFGIGGIFGGALIGLVTAAGALTFFPLAFLVGIAFASAVLTTSFGLSYKRAHRERSSVLAEMKAAGTEPQRLQLARLR